MKVKIFNLFKKAIKELFWFIAVLGGCILITGILSFLFKDYALIILKFFNLIFISYFSYKLLILISWIFKVDEIRRLKKSTSLQGAEKPILYLWMGRNYVEETFFYDLLKEPIKNNFVENLREIKEKIKNIGSDISDYYLIKGYLELHEKNNINSKIGILFSSVLVGAISSVITKFASSNTVLTKLISLLSIGKKHDFVQSGSTIIEIITFMIIIFSLYIFIVHEFTKERRRMEIIKMVVDMIIKDKEKEIEIRQQTN